MTSRNLFFKLQKEDLKRRIWTIALASLVFFIAYPVVVAMLMESYSNNSDMYRDNVHQMNQILHFIGPTNEFGIIILIVGAVICGLSGFFYLHSKKKVDFYHSMPVRRELLFAVSFINGILIYIIPYVISILMCFVILVKDNFMTMDVFTMALSAIGMNLLYYTLIYTIVVIAVMMTGNLFISFLGAGVFFFYGPFLMLMKEAYYSLFFNTYYLQEPSYSSAFLFLSPIGRYIESAKKIADGNGTNIAGNIVVALIVTVLLIAAALYLYKKRSSEAAGKAMAFGISKPIIKFLLVVPITLGGGVFFREVSERQSTGWLVFGLIFTLIIIYAIMEIIYNFDIRCALKHKKQLLACMSVVAIIVIIFQFDIFRYDAFIPDDNEVKSMSVSIGGLDDDIQYYELNNEGLNYMNSNEYQMKNMKLKDFNAAYDLAKIGLNNVNHDFTNQMNFTYTVKYNMKNGKEVYRSYKLTPNESYDLIKEIYSKSEFKEGHYPIYQLDVGLIGVVSCNNVFDSKEFSLSFEEKNQLLETYKEELSNLTLEQHAESSIATISFTAGNNRLYTNLSVYPSFTKTIAFLKNHGFDASKLPVAEDIKEITITNYNNYEASNNDVKETANQYVQASEYKTATYTEKDKIEEIYKNLVLDQYAIYNTAVSDTDNSISVNVLIKTDQYGNEAAYTYYFNNGGMPDFVKEDIGYIE